MCISCVLSSHYTIHSFFFSQSQKNIEIDLDLLRSHYALVYILRKYFSVAYFVIRQTIIARYIYIYIYILFYSLVALFMIKWTNKKSIFVTVWSTNSIEVQQQLKQQRIFMRHMARKQSVVPLVENNGNYFVD
jgi:hypothetical protein